MKSDHQIFNEFSASVNTKCGQHS